MNKDNLIEGYNNEDLEAVTTLLQGYQVRGIFRFDKPDEIISLYEEINKLKESRRSLAMMLVFNDVISEAIAYDNYLTKVELHIAMLNERLEENGLEPESLFEGL